MLECGEVIGRREIIRSALAPFLQCLYKGRSFSILFQNRMSTANWQISCGSIVSYTVSFITPLRIVELIQMNNSKRVSSCGGNVK